MTTNSNNDLFKLEQCQLHQHPLRRALKLSSNLSVVIIENNKATKLPIPDNLSVPHINFNDDYQLFTQNYDFMTVIFPPLITIIGVSTEHKHYFCLNDVGYSTLIYFDYIGWV